MKSDTNIFIRKELDRIRVTDFRTAYMCPIKRENVSVATCYNCTYTDAIYLFL